MLPGKNDIMTATERYKSNCSPSKSCFHIDTTTLNKIPKAIPTRPSNKYMKYLLEIICARETGSVAENLSHWVVLSF